MNDPRMIPNQPIAAVVGFLTYQSSFGFRCQNADLPRPRAPAGILILSLIFKRQGSRAADCNVPRLSGVKYCDRPNKLIALL
jgi:hypothetical protein